MRTQNQNSRTRYRRSNGLGLTGAVALCGAALAAPAQARRAAPAPAASAGVNKAQAEAQQKLSRGILALAQRDFVTAYREFSEAYRLVPNVDVLYQLGIVSSAEGKPVEAQDLLRRYLAEASSGEISATKRAEAERILAQPLDAAGELRVLGDAGTELQLDGRLVGRLPLPRPLLVTATPHQLALITANSRREVAVQVRAGGAAEVRAEAAQPALTAVPLQTVLPLVSASSASDGAMPPWSELLGRAIEGAKGAVYDPAVLSARGLSGACWEGRTCLGAFSEQSAPDWLLYLDVQAAPGSTRLVATLLDVRGGVPVATAEQKRQSYDADGAQKALGELATKLLTEAQGPRSAIAIAATPPEVEVTVSGWRLGTPPLERQLLRGTYELVLSAPGYVTERRTVVVGESPSAKVEAHLQLPPPPPVIKPPELRWETQPRPLWRVVPGAVAIAAGAAMIGLGAWALSVNGGCIDALTPPMQACPSVYSTTGVGAGLLAGGALLGIGGTVLLALPGQRRQVPVESGSAPRLSWLLQSGSFNFAASANR